MKCQNVNCYNGVNCPITQETHDLVKNQILEQELKSANRCITIIKHELLKKRYGNIQINQAAKYLRILDQIKEYMN